MDILRKGCQGNRVVELQELLRSLGYSIQPDGIFGQQTWLAVCRLQQKAGLAADGIVGKNTWNAIIGNKNENSITPPAPPRTIPQQEKTSKLNFAEIARLLNVEEAAIRAVSEVESDGRSGFLPDGRPMILFEGHIFWRELKKRGFDPERYQEEYRDVLSPRWDRTSYKGGAAEHDRLRKAARINEEAALCSASWGVFQIMGFNHKACGYETVQEYVADIKAGSDNHLLCFARFLINIGIDDALRNRDWARFAEKYNGPGYRQNRYDEKLLNAYLKYRKQLNNGQ